MVDKFNSKIKKPGSSGKKVPHKHTQKSLLSFFTPKTDAAAVPTTPGAGSLPMASDRVNNSLPLQSFRSDTVASRTLSNLPVRDVESPQRTPKTSHSRARSSDDEDLYSRAPKRTRRQVISEDGHEEAIASAVDSIETSEDNSGVPDNEDEDIANQPKSQTAPELPRKTPSKPSAGTLTSKFAFPSKSADITITNTSLGKQPAPATPCAPKMPGKVNKQPVMPPWLMNVHDASGNPAGHPEYDPRTLHIPVEAWNKFTPFEKQYWEIKSQHYDTVVFFRKGKFYELFEHDAFLGNREFGLGLTTRISMTMVGMPVDSFDYWAAQFIAKGYKVAKVDQSETPIARDMRDREKSAKGGKKDALIRRELVSVLTGGTLVDEAMLQGDMSTYCVAIKENTTDDETPLFGITFVDTATGAFSLTEFEDDTDLTKFETLVAQIRPKELILEKGCISKRAVRILKSSTTLTTIWNKLIPGKEFWDAGTTVQELNSQKYFGSNTSDGYENWPEALQSFKSNDLVISSFGALLYYLQTLKINQELVTLKNFQVYDPIKMATSLVLDGQTLLNLEIFANSHDGSAAGTLFAILNQCITPFGKRMMKRWVCHPLSDAAKINARLDAIDELNANDTCRDVFSSQLSKLPDLERLISRVHAGSSKPIDFLRVLEGFESIQDAVEEIEAQLDCSSEGLIGQLVSAMPDLDALLKPWSTAFDREKVKESGILVPEAGIEPDFDEAQEIVDGILEMMNGLLKTYMKDLRCRDLKFVDVGLETHTVEVPINIAKHVPKTWQQVSGTSKVKRFYPPELRKLVRSLEEAQESRDQIGKEVTNRFYQRFDEDYQSWLLTVHTIANLDCLIGLAKASSSLGVVSCRPTFVDDERTVLRFEELRHPCIVSARFEDFIPNDIELGGDCPNITLLTGANAAGKSTILRMTCIGVIMAQIGCYIPCKSAVLTPIDRILSRLGANDNIFQSQSTFFVELSETQKILNNATPRSLVIIDELGRGTSTYDGISVAQSVLHHIATHTRCVGYFATHYHYLAVEFATHPEIRRFRMKIDVGDDDGERDITFLYQLEEGVADGSFGMHCAAKCGINRRIIDRAEEVAKKYEHASRVNVKDTLYTARMDSLIPLGLQSDISYLLNTCDEVQKDVMDVIVRSVALL
ncbi:muts domain V-domain-containing protein [Trichophaea hybrida]|nr:muts domain V-domain-containing protein [Trichophaea hybrida]